MPVEFTLELNVESSTRGDYRDFIQNLRARLGVRSSHNRPALAVQPDKPNPPTRFFDLVLRTNDHAVRFRFRMDNLYLLAYQMEDGQWWEFDNWEKDDKGKKTKRVHLIAEPGIEFLGFEGSYGALAGTAHRSIEQMRVGVHNLVDAINHLAVTTDWADRARSLVVVIMMISESTRLIPIFDFVANSFDNRPGTFSSTESQIQGWILDLVRSWYNLSAALLRADANPEERFLSLEDNNIRIPPNNRQIRSIADAIAIIGILLGLCFKPGGPKRAPRSTSDDGDDDGQCFLGLPLMQVFSVQINDIDGEDPGHLYGTIVVDDGLFTQYVYDRTRDNYEYIKPGQNATLIGPSRSVSAFGNVTIKLLLTDRDFFTWDDVIMNESMSWDSANIGDVYDKLISQKLDSSRGSITVNYAVLRNAVAARVTVSVEGNAEWTNQVYGHVSACYNDNWEDPKTTCLLFDRTSKDYVEVKLWQTIPLLRSVVAVPLNHSLKVTARLYDHDIISADDVIANGTVEIPVPDTVPATTFNSIHGDDGNYVTVTVYWSSGF